MKKHNKYCKLTVILAHMFILNKSNNTNDKSNKKTPYTAEYKKEDLLFGETTYNTLGCSHHFWKDFHSHFHFTK